MARCEDFPCCGHESGCCPDFSPSGKQLNMKCTCGATLPLTSRSSICAACLRRGEEDYGDCPDVETRYPDDYDAYNPELDRDDEDEDCDDERDAELDRDIILERQELEDFEQADEYFNGGDYSDPGDW